VVASWSPGDLCRLDLPPTFCKLSEQRVSASETKWSSAIIQAAANRPQSERIDNLFSKKTV
jgi:hypothetical protein